MKGRKGKLIKSVVYSPVILLVLLLALIWIGSFFYKFFPYYTLRTIDPLLNPLFYPEDTMYTQMFSQEVFDSIKMGTHRDEVLEKLGEPFVQNVGTNGKVFLIYSKAGPKHDNYQRRIIYLNNELRVIGKDTDFYYD